MLIIVTGATGRLGSQIVERLLDLLPADQIRATARHPGKASALAQRGVDIRHGDFSQPETLVSAFAGADQLLLVSSNARATGGDTLAQHRAAIDAARAAGVRRIVYTSQMAANPDTLFLPARDHVATEEMLAESGVAWTALRNGYYASTVPMLIGDAASSGTIEAPADGPVAWTNHADLAAGAARILVEEGRFDGPTPPLTAGEAVDLEQVAGIMSEITGKTIQRSVVSDDEHRRRMTQAGLPPSVIAITLSIFEAARANEFAKTSPLLAELIGKIPQPINSELLDVYKPIPRSGS